MEEDEQAELLREKEEEGKSLWKIIRIAAIALVTVVGLWFYYWHWIDTQCWDQATKGQFGDMFGTINALFTGLAFAGVIVTIILQSQELKLQRKELRDTKNEFKKQNETMKSQKFDSTFFNQLRLYNELSKTCFQNPIVYHIRNDYFKRLKTFKAISTQYKYLSPTGPDTLVSLSTENIVIDNIGNHLKNFESIILIIDEYKRTPAIRMKFFKIFFAQLSTYERILYFYHFHLSKQPPFFSEYQNELFSYLQISSEMNLDHWKAIQEEYYKK